LTYARQFFQVDNASFNLLQWALKGPLGASFIGKAKRLKRAIFVWTVNEEKDMRWCIQKEFDGVISDDPKKFLDLCDDWEQAPNPVGWTLGEWFGLFKMQFLIGLYYFMFRWRVGSGIEKRYRAEGKKVR
jgi:phosphatidylglycerol phospholipase C